MINLVHVMVPKARDGTSILVFLLVTWRRASDIAFMFEGSRHAKAKNWQNQGTNHRRVALSGMRAGPNRRRKLGRGRSWFLGGRAEYDRHRLRSGARFLARHQQPRNGEFVGVTRRGDRRRQYGNETWHFPNVKLGSLRKK